MKTAHKKKGSSSDSSDDSEAEELYYRARHGDVNVDYIYRGFNRVKGLLDACVKAWQKAWFPGWLLVADETMV